MYIDIGFYIIFNSDSSDHSGNTEIRAIQPDSEWESWKLLTVGRQFTEQKTLPTVCTGFLHPSKMPVKILQIYAKVLCRLLNVNK